MTEVSLLICPKCRGSMRTYERNGILIDQCEECRGIFLDHGELEQLLDTARDLEQRSEHDAPQPGDHDRDDHDHEKSGDRHHDSRRESPRSRASTFISDFLGGGESTGAKTTHGRRR